MSQITAVQKRARRQAVAVLATDPNVVSIGVGYKYVAGTRTDVIGVVVGVRKKLPADELTESQVVPRAFEGVATDVIEKGEIEAYGFLQKKRPCPPGFSIGHISIGAGTLGAYVRRGDDPDYRILSNNHVLADSNNALPYSDIIQPGKADGGVSWNDRFGRLDEYVRIRWDEPQDGKEAAAAWNAWKAPGNFIARALGSASRLVVGTLAVEQPYPNLVDAALATIWNPGYVDLDIPEIGELQGLRDLQLGNAVQKTGRTTEHTTGMVEEVEVQVRVRYSRGLATFDDQFVIRADPAGGTSDGFGGPGDSGSAIVTEDGYLGGLLFAGGDTDTIANRISNVVALLGIRL